MAFCANCGAKVDGRFCQTCGAAVNAAPAGGGTEATPGPPPPQGSVPPPPPPPPLQVTATAMTDNVAGALCYLLGLITGIIFLVLAPYSTNRNVKFNAFQSIFFNLAWVVIWIVMFIISIALHVLPVLGTIMSAFLYFVLWISGLILWLYLMFKTYNGEKVVLPVIGPMAEKQANV